MREQNAAINRPPKTWASLGKHRGSGFVEIHSAACVAEGGSVHPFVGKLTADSHENRTSCRFGTLLPGNGFFGFRRFSVVNSRDSCSRHRWFGAIRVSTQRIPFPKWRDVGRF
jgi:hypothetical protein